MGVFGHPENHGHENVVFCRDEKTGLSGIIVIHSTALGPAAGGCRMHPYASEDEALTDALRLAEGMSYKNALAGLPLGGGKSVVIGDPRGAGKAEKLRAFAAYVARLGGAYWTAIDIGVSPEDAEMMAEVNPFTFCRASQYPQGFSPAEYTARGGLVGIRACVKRRTGGGLQGVRVAVQGCGATGARLARMLADEGAELIVADVHAPAAEETAARTGGRVVAPEEIHKVEADVFAPCAMGAVLNEATIPKLGAGMVCGLANNQLATPGDGERLVRRGVLYAPDFIVNAGGMMGSGRVIFGDVDEAKSLAAIEGIAETLSQVFARAEDEGRDPGAVAAEMARERIAGAR